MNIFTLANTEQHVKYVTVCITYDTVCTHFHIIRYEICQSTLSWQGLRWSQSILVVSSINTRIYKELTFQKHTRETYNEFTPPSSSLFPHNYVLPFSNAYGAKIVALAACIKKLMNVLKFDSYPSFLILKLVIQLEPHKALNIFKYCKRNYFSANMNSKAVKSKLTNI